MLEGVNTRRNYIVGRLPAVDMHRYGTSGVVRFFYSGADFLDRIMVVVAVCDELDQISAVENVLADGFSDLLRAIRLIVFKTPERTGFRGQRSALTSKRRNDFAGC